MFKPCEPYILALILAIIIILALLFPAFGHSIYDTWQMPDRRTADGARTISCCSGVECYYTAFRRESGHWQFLQRETRKWLPIPDGKIEQNYRDEWESPDGLSHICANPGGTVFCATIGSGM